MTNIRARLTVTTAFAVLLLAAPQLASAFAAPTPVTVPASLIGYNTCMEFAETRFQRLVCKLILADPPADQTISIDYTLAFDPSRIEIPADVARFFGDFSASGTQIPLTLAPIGGIHSFEPDPGIDWLTTTQPRSGTSAVFEVDNALGIASLHFDLSANPTPPDSPPQNFFGFLILSRVGPIGGIEYFDVPGDYDLRVTSFSCSTIDDRPCGSTHPVYGFNIHVVPEPSAGLLTMSGLILLLVVLRRRFV